MSGTFKVEGLKSLEANLRELKQGTGRGVMRRTLKKSARPLVDLIELYAPDDPRTANDDLVSGIVVTSKATRNAKRMIRASFKDSTAVEMFVGPDKHVFYGIFQEFGTVHHAPQPFMRPAWEEDKMALMGRIKNQLGVEIEKTLARMARSKG